VVCRTTFLPFRDFAQEWVKPRKSNEWALQSGGVPPATWAAACPLNSQGGWWFPSKLPPLTDAESEGHCPSRMGTPFRNSVQRLSMLGISQVAREHQNTVCR
jgi:hypothetical protein